MHSSCSLCRVMRTFTVLRLQYLLLSFITLSLESIVWLTPLDPRSSCFSCYSLLFSPPFLLYFLLPSSVLRLFSSTLDIHSSIPLLSSPPLHPFSPLFSLSYMPLFLLSPPLLLYFPSSNHISSISPLLDAFRRLLRSDFPRRGCFHLREVQG
jgi:hypothetical protein